MTAATPNWNEFWDVSKSTKLNDDHSYDLIYTDAMWWEDSWPAKKWAKITRAIPSTGVAEVLSAIVVWHKDKTGQTCGALTHFLKPRIEAEKQLDYRIYRVESFEPLQIVEAIFCKLCNDCGYIQDGKWIPIDV